jgi:hypothetical protein
MPTVERLPAFGEIVRNSSITNRSSGVNAPSASSGAPVIVRVNHDLTLGSP